METKTTVKLNLENFKRLKKLLIDRDSNFTRWIDEQITRELDREEGKGD